MGGYAFEDRLFKKKKKKLSALCREGFFCCCETQVPASFCAWVLQYIVFEFGCSFPSEEIARSVWLVVKLGVWGGEDVAAPQSRLHFLCRRRTG